jgi:diguanylate cyclase (GGDEF)-like protein
MKFNAKTLRSRVSRRIFLLFLLAAVLPIIIISIISYKHINQQMAEDAQRQLHQESRALGLAVYDRLITLETILANISDQINTHRLSPEFWESKSLRRMYEDINEFGDNGSRKVLLGKPIERPSLNEKQRQFLKKGNAVVTTDRTDSGLALVLVTYPVSTDGTVDDKALLVGRPKDEYIWNFGIYSPEIACSLTKEREIMDCSTSVDRSALNAVFMPEVSSKRLKTWQYGDRTYMSFIWDLFLGAQFHSDDIGIMLAKPKHYSLSDINSFNTIFPKSLLITGLVVLVLTISQIRKYLNPLEQLMLGTKRISDGIFNKPVQIKSNDEFEVLGESFNTMAQRISEQIGTLRMMSNIDHMILSSLDSNHITSVLIDNCHSLFPVDHIAVVRLNGENVGGNTITYNIDKTFGEKKTESIEINNERLLNEYLHSDYLWVDDSDKSAYLQPLISQGDKYFLVLPFMSKLQLTGLLCLGNRKSFEVDNVKLQQLRELGDRVAVALSNAAWEDKLYYQAHYDALTGLPNRYLLKDRLEQAVAWATRGNGKIALLLIDLDRFKFINDSLGHSVGDELLIQVAERLASCVRASDTLSRFGGDEFTIILMGDVGNDDIFTQASRLSNRLRELFESPFLLQDREIFITPSIGIATCPDDANNLEDLFKYADNAMYQAKGNGLGQFHFYDQVHNKNILMKLDLEADLRHALKRGELYVVYQPKIDCSSGRISGAEALIHWTHPQWGNIPSMEFIPIAEETGMIFEIGNWVLRSACKQTKDWLNRGIADISIAVNLSGEQFRRTGIEETVGGILTESGLPASRLELELTENVTIENFQKTIEFLDNFHKLGITISIDDFGTGYSSMSYLQQFNIDRIKIDKSFIDKIPENKQSVSIVDAIIAMAHGLDLSVTAEGVETQEQYEYLMQTGIDELQGFYFSRPLEREAFERFCLEFEKKRKSYA